MNTKVYYSIVSSVRFSRNEENRRIIEEHIKKGEPNFLIREDDYGECFEMDIENNSTAGINEDWLLEKVIELAKKYKITEFELWKKNEGDPIYDKGIGIEIEAFIGNLGVKFKESYSGSLDDWKLSWVKGEKIYKKIYVKQELY
ncbi:DUF5514 family protein [Bacillus toyonensis]|uniref:DUF5514 family protein n=1 Tax=Bacillus toyonensis TaxID=155322 RepID=UPI001C0DF050|nr:DUF5514 family protein [Bacillus toyonensis]MBU4643064.1 DUF5514 family protein [Bacillus toyonensis]